MKVGIYGGSFNPPHLGHMAAAQGALEALQLDLLVLVPSRVPPHKALPAGSPTPEERLELTRIMADQLGAKVEAWDVELCREGKSYTAQTLAQAAQRWPGAELWLLVGTDLFLTWDQWYHPEEIMSLAGICAFGRAPEDERAFPAQRAMLEERYGARVEVISIPHLVEVSSTQVRELLGKGAGREFLSQPVYGAILRRKLYGTHADLAHLTMEELRCVSYSMVRSKRLPHIRGTEEEAASLARRWGADEEQMRRAAILHDCTKYLTLEEHLEICDRYGEPLDEMERGAVKLLHAKSGAALARAVFGQEEIVCTAISYHTTGRAHMTLEEKILYMADYIEPCRDFDGVEEMRRLAYVDLDQAVLMGAEMSVEDMMERNQAVHENTLATCRWLRGEE